MAAKSAHYQGISGYTGIVKIAHNVILNVLTPSFRIGLKGDGFQRINRRRRLRVIIIKPPSGGRLSSNVVVMPVSDQQVSLLRDQQIIM